MNNSTQTGFKVPEKFRIAHPLYDGGDNQNGAFAVGCSKDLCLKIIASNGDGWEHVSVSAVFKDKAMTPTWSVMCMVKDLFWSDDVTVLQYHPPKDEYINFHPNCLHLWRQIGTNHPLPPTYMVGPKIEGCG